MSSSPVVIVDKVREDICNQYKIEQVMIMAMIASLPATYLLRQIGGDCKGCHPPYWSGQCM